MSTSNSHETESVVDTLILSNKLDELTKLSRWVNDLAERFGLSPNDKFRLDLALAEAVTNVIRYAFKDKTTHEITVTLEYLDKKAIIQVKDEGKPFDPLKHPKVIFPRSLEEASKGGLGIHLIRTYTDECYYRREDDTNILTMIICDSTTV